MTMRAHPVRGSEHHPWVAAACLALLLFFWVGNCFGQGSPGPSRHPTLIETPYAPAGYIRLLKEYVVRVPGENGAVETRVDYQRFYAAPNQRAVRDELRKRFLSVDPETLDPSSHTAWAVNAYNFLVIDAVMEHITTTGRYWLESVSKIGDKEFEVFDRKWIPMGKETWSLNRFEHHFLFQDIDRTTGKGTAPVDPRLHFVLVCAATGCPPLLPDPLHPEHLEKDLDEATRDALRSPRQVRLEGNTLHASKIFEWYAADFQTVGLREFLVRYAPDSVRKALEDPNRDIQILTDIEWSWLLNRP